MITAHKDSFHGKENGATAIEYAMIAAFLAITIVTAVTLLGDTLAIKYQALVNLF